MRAAGAPSRRPPRLGFLGVGWIGRDRLDAIVDSGIAEVAMVADPSEDATRAAAERAGGPPIGASLEDLLHADLDGVVIATPSGLHAQQAVAAIDRGLAVFCQKPLARNGDEARQVVESARAADRLLGVDLSYRHLSGISRLRELVASGELGDVFAIDATFHNAYGPDKAWCRDRRLSGGGCLIDLGVHLVDAALWILDFPSIASASGRLYSGGHPFVPSGGEVEDYAVARFDLRTGASVSIACSWNLPAGSAAVIRVACYGTRGGAAVENINGSFYDFRTVRYRGTATEVLSEAPEPWGGRAIVSWARRLAESASFSAEAQQFVAVSRALDLVYAS